MCLAYHLNSNHMDLVALVLSNPLAYSDKGPLTAYYNILASFKLQAPQPTAYLR